MNIGWFPKNRDTPNFEAATSSDSYRDSGLNGTKPVARIIL